jgi:hypothetical protein
MSAKSWLHALAFCLCGPAGAAVTVTSDDVVVVMDAMPSTELTADAAQRYNVSPAANRGVLTVNTTKHGKPVPSQVYVGAVNSKNNLINVPMRALPDTGGHLGEFYVLPNDNLNFIVNVNVLGKPLKAKFSRAFNP